MNASDHGGEHREFDSCNSAVYRTLHVHNPFTKAGSGIPGPVFLCVGNP